MWSPASAALASLAERFGDEVWELLFSELEGVYGRKLPSLEGDSAEGDDNKESIGGLGGIDEDDEDEDDKIEEETTWRNPSGYKLRVALRAWLREDMRIKPSVSLFLPTNRSTSLTPF